ncbi:MAG: hypothetical protein GY871_00315 [Actinomycetales bacterium]|nr:hypothetical protein [Actinomycetales bacterium]
MHTVGWDQHGEASRVAHQFHGGGYVDGFAVDAYGDFWARRCHLQLGRSEALQPTAGA